MAHEITGHIYDEIVAHVEDLRSRGERNAAITLLAWEYDELLEDLREFLGTSPVFKVNEHEPPDWVTVHGMRIERFPHYEREFEVIPVKT